ncbi:MAG: hypothetical protein CVU84_02250 [Firmicutes bacterium HGW-Firmicutes-1]|jgi:FMN reductase [NAD(P)H]|nr:MAG: hypothetical protein CVU84_02250 [Firmicutes bacterium HGW-Firmicutes-1]
MNEVIKTILGLKTTRKSDFSNRIIEDEKIELIKQAIIRTSNASNRQSYSIIVLDEEKAREASLPGNRVFVFCIDFLRLHKCAEQLKCELDSQYFMQYTTALIDISLLIQSTVIAAQSLGIDTLITNEIYQNKLDTISPILNIPEAYVFPMIAVCMGYSKTEKKVEKGRIDSKYIFFDNEYGKCSIDDIKRIINETDSEERNIGLIQKWNEMGYNHYYEWFFNKWSQTIGTKSESEALEKTLKAHKIL